MRKHFLLTFIITSLLSLSGCNNPGANNGKSNDLELLYFGKPINQTQNRMAKAPYRLNEEESDEKNYDITYNSTIALEAYVKNTNRLAFLDIVVFSEATGKKYVFNDGFGDYTVESSTILEDNVWTTKLRFNWIPWSIFDKKTDSCMFDTYLQIEEINFLTVSGNVTQTNIAQSNVRKVNIHAKDNAESDSHTWSPWEYRDRTCEEFAGRYHYCTVCGVDYFEIQQGRDVDWDTISPLGHLYTGEWKIINATPGVISGSDLFQSVGTCSRCGKVISHSLNSFNVVNDLLYDLVIPEGIKTIEDQAFYYFRYLKTITFPQSIESIGYGAFEGSEKLEDVYFTSSVPPKHIGGQLFDPVWRDESKDFTIHVPCDALEAYQNINDTNSYWRNFGVPNLDANVHPIENWNITKQVSCTEDGERTGLCPRCNKTVTEVILSKGHQYDAGTVIGYDEHNKPITKYTCTICGDVQTKYSEDSHHTFVKGNKVTNSQGKPVTSISCICGLTGYEMDLRDCDTPEKIDSTGRVTASSNLKWRFKVSGGGMVDFYMCAKLSRETDPGFPSDYSLMAGTSTGTIDAVGQMISDLGATTTNPVYFKIGSVMIKDSDLDENGEINIALRFSSHTGRYLFSDSVRIIYQEQSQA